MGTAIVFFIGLLMGASIGAVTMALAILSKSSDDGLEYFLVKMNKAQADHWNASHPE